MGLLAAGQSIKIGDGRRQSWQSLAQKLLSVNTVGLQMQHILIPSSAHNAVWLCNLQIEATIILRNYNFKWHLVRFRHTNNKVGLRKNLATFGFKQDTNSRLLDESPACLFLHSNPECRRYIMVQICHWQTYNAVTMQWSSFICILQNCILSQYQLSGIPKSI